MLLSELGEGEKSRIKRVSLLGKPLAKAWELGIRKGEEVAVLKKYRHGGGVVTVSGTNISLGREVVSKIEVED